MDYNKFDAFIGEELLDARLDKRMTQETLTKLINYELIIKQEIRKNGIARQTYSNYENGIRSIPNDIFLCACIALGIDPIKTFKKASDKYAKATIQSLKKGD